MPLAVGVTLREERLRRQLSIDEISRRTRIPARFLEAIEAQDYSRLPGVVFTRSFVRQYAVCVGLDHEPLLAVLPRVDIDSAPLPAPPPGARKRSKWDPRITSALASLGWLLMASGASVAAYLHFNRPKAPEAGEPVPAVSRPAAKLEVAAPVEVAAPASESVPVPIGLPVQVVLTAREAAWVDVVADGKPAFSGTLNPSDSRSIAANELVKVTTGNAGGLEISLNGKPVDALGPSGQVRTIKLTAEGPLSSVRTQPPPPDPI